MSTLGMYAEGIRRFCQEGQNQGKPGPCPLPLKKEGVAKKLVQAGVAGAGIVQPAVLPEALKQVWTWISEGSLSIDIEKVPLKDISRAWVLRIPGKRIVMVP